MTKEYEDPEKLARLYFKHGNYADVADELNCSVGTVSLKMDKYEEEIAEYDEGDFSYGTTRNLDEVSVSDVEDAVRGAMASVGYGKEDVRVNTFNPKFVVDDADMAVWISEEDGLAQAFGEASICGYRNTAVAVSEHLLEGSLKANAMIAGPGLLSVSEDGIRVECDSTLVDNSGIMALLDDEADSYTKYKNKEWLRIQYKKHNRDPIDIAEECSVRTPTIKEYLDKFRVR